jgi:DNA-binding NtrC family response regulator
MNTFKLLLIEDDPQICQFVRDGLVGAGYEVKTASTGREALALVETTIFDAALVDLHLPDTPGIEVFESAKRRDPEMDIVVMAGEADVETAMQALSLGAYDYLITPLQWVPLEHCLKRILERRYLRKEVSSLRSRLAVKPIGGKLEGSSTRIQELKGTIASIASMDTPVLIEGERGTGKELIAYAIHDASARSKNPFVRVNCASIPPTLIERELFGNQNGPFLGAASEGFGLFQSADGGTLFLDDVSELSSQVQARLGRILQEKVSSNGNGNGNGNGAKSHPIGVRVIAATNRRLESAVQEGRFEADLYFMLNAVRIDSLPLREMKSDIPMLVAHFIRSMNAKFGRSVDGISGSALSALCTYDFPGNVRELENMLERAYALGVTNQIQLADLPTLSRNGSTPLAYTEITPNSLDNFERELIVATLRMHENDKEKAAQYLGMSERTLYRRLKKFGVN